MIDHRRKISPVLYQQVQDAYAIARALLPHQKHDLDGLHDEAQVKRIRSKMNDESGYGRFDDLGTGAQYNVRVTTRRPDESAKLYIVTLEKIERENDD